MLFSLIAVAAVILELFGGSFWIFSLAITALVVKLYPVAMLLVIGFVAVWAIRKLR
jgi:hypothetical protein